MAASGSGGKEPGGPPWTATSTWVPGPAGGTVEDAASFETSDDDPEASPAGVVLCHPPADSDRDMAPCPCEVTVSFRGKYEIHRVYVRSTARIYELYQSPDAKGTNKDYLCTVRCGLAVKEPHPCGEESMSQWTDSALNSDKRGNEAKSISSGSDEDSWVDVKIPESPAGNKTLESQERNVIQTCQENTLAHYEATAEMTDMNPCVSLTIRFLSLQSKTSVHIEEIYIFADPVESTNDDSVRGPGNMGGSSLLAMLVPGLMQMSKSRNLKIDDGYFSDGSRNQESSTCERVTQESWVCSTNDLKSTSAGIESGMRPIVGATVSDEKSSQGEFQLKHPDSRPLPVQTLESTQAPSVKDQRELNTGHLANPHINENFTPYNHIERKLDTLLSKVEKMELYCSRFEDIMIKPLGSIEARLQRLEEQFNSFSVGIQSLRGSSAFRSAPDGMSNTTSSQEEAHNDANDKSTPTTDRKPGLVVREPDFISNDPCGYNVITNGNHVNFGGPNMVPSLLVKVPGLVSDSPELTDGNLHAGPALSSDKERKTSPGLAVKVPEFLDDDDDDDDDDDEVEEKKQAEVCGDGDHHTWSDDTLRKSTAGNTKSKKNVSINGALASALEALLASTKGTSSSKPAVCTTSNLSAENIDNSFSCSLSPRKNCEMSTKDGSADQFLGASGDANLVGGFISSPDIDTTPHNSISKEMLDSRVEINEQNDDTDTSKVAFVAITEPLDVPSQTDTIEESIDDGSLVNRQNNGPNLNTMPYVLYAGPLDPPTVFEPVDSGVEVNENRPSISLVEFLAARNASSCKNGTSEVCLGNDGAKKLSFERTSVRADKNSKNVSQLLVKKALEVDADERNLLSSVPIEANFEGSSSNTPRTRGGSINDTKEAVSDEECGLKNTENGFRTSSMDSILSQYHATDSNNKVIENNSLDWSLDESFSKQNGEHSWSSSSSMGMESFSGAPAREPVISGNDTSGNYVEDLAGIGDRPVATLISGEELQKVCDLLYEFKDDMLGMSSAAKGTNKSGPSLEVLLAESSDSEAQISDLEGIDSGTGIGSARLFSTLSSSDDDAASADEPLFDVADLTTTSEPYTVALNEPLVNVAFLTNSSRIHASSVNEPSADVVDLLHTSDEPLLSLNDLPNLPEMSFGGSSGEHPEPDSLI